MDADPEIKPAVGRKVRVADLGCPLDFERAAGCRDDAAKFGEKTVSRVLEHAAIMRDYLGVDDFGAQRPQPRQHSLLVYAGQAREAGDIRRQYSRQAPFHPFAGQ